MRVLFGNMEGAVEAALVSAQEELRYFWCVNLASNPSALGEKLDARWNAEQTDADIECNSIISRKLSELPFSANIYSEESDPIEHGDAQVSFLIDPLDGTHNASAGYPMYSCSVAMHDGRDYSFGWIYDISRDISYVALRGAGAYRKTPLVCRRLKTTESNLYLEQISVSLLRGRDGAYRDRVTELFWNAGKIRVSSCSTLDMCLVAAGTLDVFLDPSERGHERTSDIAASSLILEEAGGHVLNLDGTPRDRLPPSVEASADLRPMIASGSRVAADALLSHLHESELEKSVCSTMP